MSMYYPYLRGKQFELIALRDFANENPDNHNICPIIEPVKENLKFLDNTIKGLKDHGEKFILILNPNEGDFRGKSIDLVGGLVNLADSKWVPGLIYSHNCEELGRLIQSQHLDNVVIIFKDGIDFERDDSLEKFLSQENIDSVVVSNADTRAGKRKLQNLGKKIIRLDDNFHEQKRNADYLNVQDEQFTEEPFYFKEDSFEGFSDFTTLPKSFTEGGSLPYAVAIHLTYHIPGQKMVYIHHFVSEKNFDQSNIQGKFAEAARKAIVFFHQNPTYFHSSSLDELEGYVNEERYPGLGVIKKISIKHHLQLINHILEKNENQR